jgi:hypothetical protein
MPVKGTVRVETVSFNLRRLSPIAPAEITPAPIQTCVLRNPSAICMKDWLWTGENVLFPTNL